MDYEHDRQQLARRACTPRRRWAHIECPPNPPRSGALAWVLAAFGDHRHAMSVGTEPARGNLNGDPRGLNGACKARRARNAVQDEGNCTPASWVSECEFARSAEKAADHWHQVCQTASRACRFPAGRSLPASNSARSGCGHRIGMIGDRTAIRSAISVPGTITLIGGARSGIAFRVLIPNSASEPSVASATSDRPTL